MASGPTLFDGDGGSFDDADPSEGAPAGADAPDAPTNRSDEGPPVGRPNYLFRRAVVVGGVVAVVATAAIVVGNLIGSGATSSVSGAIEADWNRIVQIDERLGRVTVQNDEGDELERVDTGRRNTIATGVVGPTALLVDADTVAVVDLASADTTESDLAADRIVVPAGSALTLVAADGNGERGLLVHGPSGDLVDTAEFAPIPGTRYQFDTARAAPSGRDVLITDSANFQSVLFSFDRDEPSYFTGLALAVDDEVVVTAQNVGADATVNVFRHDEEPISSGRTSSVRAALIAGDRVQLVTVEGRVVEMDLDDGDTSDGEQLDVGTVQVGHVWTSGDRIVVIGSDGTAIVSDTGDVLATIEGAVPVDADATSTSRCLLVDATTGPTDRNLTMIDVTDGSIVAESDRRGSVLVSADGCTALIVSDTGLELLDETGATAAETPADVIALTPDATGAVVYREGRSILVPIEDLLGAEADEPDTEPVDLGPDGRVIAFTEL